MSALLGVRPLGLLQGPPGTGKTKFIAALTHYALAKGLARNVLLASQSHEAVNNAAELVLALFRGSGGDPSILRVGAEGVVSDRLLPYHTERVELLFKDRFRAQQSERLRIAGVALGLPEDLVNQILFVETAVRPVCERIAELTGGADPDPSRVDGLRQTLRAHLAYLGLPDDQTWVESDMATFVDDAVGALVERRKGELRRQCSQRGPAAHRGQDCARLCDERVDGATELRAVSRRYAADCGRHVRRTRPSVLGAHQHAVRSRCRGRGRALHGKRAFGPLQAGRWIILVGDQAQLEPLHKPEVVRASGSKDRSPNARLSVVTSTVSSRPPTGLPPARS